MNFVAILFAVTVVATLQDAQCLPLPEFIRVPYSFLQSVFSETNETPALLELVPRSILTREGHDKYQSLIFGEQVERKLMGLKSSLKYKDMLMILICQETGSLEAHPWIPTDEERIVPTPVTLKTNPQVLVTAFKEFLRKSQCPPHPKNIMYSCIKRDATENALNKLNAEVSGTPEEKAERLNTEISKIGGCKMESIPDVVKGTGYPDTEIGFATSKQEAPTAETGKKKYLDPAEISP